MRALTVTPGEAGSVRVEDRPEPHNGPGELLVDGVALGVCGTDREIADAVYGTAPPGARDLVLGHESLGRVREAPPTSGFAPGDLVVGVVRRPDPEPCGACERGEFDMCRNGKFVERGIKELDGYGAEQWTVESEYAVRLDPSLADVGVLMEPTTVVAKAWDQIERIGARSWFAPRRVLVTGAGPIGLLAALLGVQRGLDVHVMDRTDQGPKPGLVKALGATYHSGTVGDAVKGGLPDIVVETTGAAPVIHDVAAAGANAGIVCLTGLPSGTSELGIDVGRFGGDLVLRNGLLFGSVNANLRHYELAADALAKADADWLARLITRRLPLERAAEAFQVEPDDVKVVIDL
ncbi:glucose 1-dehydrogenase [Actinomadura flavalba]|uniref:glucose 1-dehydrogenase n=1 Tax=Actinomadura flavalba TaxID=1120938 RepID=UPI00036725DF|nr:glucose 1-dehydrogenase [Actinomadura flavalba]